MKKLILKKSADDNKSMKNNQNAELRICNPGKQRDVTEA